MFMPLRNSLHAIVDLNDLSHLDELVVDKRYNQRSAAKKNRRNRHYEKQFIRNSLVHHLQRNLSDTIDEEPLVEMNDGPPCFPD